VLERRPDAARTVGCSATARRQRLGETTVPDDAAGAEENLGTVRSRVERGRFEDERELSNAPHPVFETLRAERSRSVVGAGRALLPF